ncbi:MAG: c-type cytochrome [Actinobacteria bacterium]|nr:c-type cytochrome [Actinomycetota bacterium]
MMGRILALSWAVVIMLAGSVAGASEPSPDVEAGREVFAANCAMCHGRDAAGMMGMHPCLRGAVDRLTREGVDVTVRNGRDTEPPMPAFEGRLTDRQLGQVIAYIETLPPGPRNFGARSDGGSMMDGMMGGGMWAIPVLVVVAIVAVIVAVVASLRSGRGRGNREPTPRELLDRRYARGELTRDDYLQRRNDLEG